MLLPTTATAVLAALILSLVGWGSWAVFYKAARKARFEFFAYDFAWGVLLTGVIAAFTFGMWDSKDLTFQDNFLLTGYRKMGWAAASGVAFNLANILLMGSIAVSRMAVAFPSAFGVAWAIGSVSTFFVRPDVNPQLAFGGAVAAFAAAIAAAISFKWFLVDRTEKAVNALNADPRSTVTAPRPTAGKGFALAAAAGIFFAIFEYALDEATSGDNGVASYGAALLVAAGVFGSSMIYVPFFLNFPVRGKALTVRQYVKVERNHHLLGVAAGIVWTVGLLAGLVTIGLPATIQAGPVTVYMLTHSAPLLALLWGWLVFRELAESPVRVQSMLVTSFVLLLAGMGMIAVAPVLAQ